MKQIKIISFYTDDWEYPEHAERLASECKSFGLDYHIVKKESTKDYILNTAMKPFFIKECLEEFKMPVAWIDVDAIILKKPEVDVSEHDIMACKHIGTHVEREWAVAFIAFDYNQETLEFVDKWCEEAVEGTDEAAFERAWQKYKDNISIGTLPETYHFVKWSFRLDVPEDTIICHQLSKFDDKLKRKNKVNGAVKGG